MRLLKECCRLKSTPNRDLSYSTHREEVLIEKKIIRMPTKMLNLISFLPNALIATITQPNFQISYFKTKEANLDSITATML